MKNSRIRFTPVLCLLVTAILFGQQASGPIAMKAVTNDDGTMTYDKKELTVTAGQTVSVSFTNPDTAQHNFLLAAPGSMKIIGAAADKMVRDDTGEDVNYVPKLPQIIYAAPVLEPKKTKQSLNSKRQRLRGSMSSFAPSLGIGRL